jgi:hypothetical protein
MVNRTNPHVYTGGRMLARGRANIRGAGMGSVLLNVGGPGVGSSYSSPQEYKEITGRPIPTGMGLGAGLNEKLQKLMIKPLENKPRHNIRF